MSEGARQMKRGQYRRAIPIFEKGLRELDRMAKIETDPSVIRELRAKFSFNLAVAYRALQNYPKSIQLFRKANSLWPNAKYGAALQRTSVLLLLATLDQMIQAGRYSGAIKTAAKYYKSLKMNDSEKAAVFGRIGEAYFLKGPSRLKRACQAFQRAARLDPQNRRYLEDFESCRDQWVLATAEDAVARGTYDEAQRILKKALSRPPSTIQRDDGMEAAMHYQLARSYLATRQIELALEEIECALSNDPESRTYLALKKQINKRADERTTSPFDQFR